MGSRRDYYEILGLKRDADDNAIKKAYRKLAKKYHPDSNAGNVQAEERFKEVTEAYDILSDPEKRKLYDRFGHAAFDGRAQGASGGASDGPGGGFYRSAGPDGSYQEYHFEGGEMDDILKNLFGGFGGFGFSGSRGGYAADGSDLEAEISDLKAKVANITAQIEEANAKITEYKHQIAENDATIEKYQAQVDHVSNSREYDSLSKEIENLDLLRQIAQKNIGETKDMILKKKGDI